MEPNVLIGDFGILWVCWLLKACPNCLAMCNVAVCIKVTGSMVQYYNHTGQKPKYRKASVNKFSYFLVYNLTNIHEWSPILGVNWLHLYVICSGQWLFASLFVTPYHMDNQGLTNGQIGPLIKCVEPCGRQPMKWKVEKYPWCTQPGK